jgi:DNA mismatch endonuclease, patch repair protein
MTAVGGRDTAQRDPATTSQIMRAVRSKNTRPELTLRRALHARGARYRLHASDVPGCPDIVVRSRQVAIFVDGDLWHGNPAEWKRRGRSNLAEMFPNRTMWWVEKIQRNVARDRKVDDLLAATGWTVLRLWASDVLSDPERCAELVVGVLQNPRPSDVRVPSRPALGVGSSHDPGRAP